MGYTNRILVVAFESAPEGVLLRFDHCKIFVKYKKRTVKLNPFRLASE